MIRRFVVLASLLVMSLGCQERAKLPAPGHLDEVARGLLETRMARHGDTAAALLWAASVFDYPTIVRFTEELMAEPQLAKPTDQDATQLNAALPPRFFELQGALVDRAKVLGDAARQKDPAKVTAAYQTLQQACMDCHLVYVTTSPPWR